MDSVFLKPLVWICLLAWVAVAGQLWASEPDAYDFFHNDSSTATLNHLTVNFPQNHEIFDTSDEDWATFYAEEGLPYAIKVESVGGGLDPQLWFYPDGPDGPGVLRDFGAFGQAETYSLLRWPATGVFWLRVRAAEMAEGPTSYTLVVTQDTGANLGMATISGAKVVKAKPEGDTIKLPDRVPYAGGGADPLPQALRLSSAAAGTTKPLYTETQLTYPADTFPDANLSALLLSGAGDPINGLEQPRFQEWLARFPGNFTITRVGIHPPTAPAQLLELAIQMRAQAVTVDLSDGPTSWRGVTLQDVPPQAKADDVQIFRWNPAREQWEVYDSNPEIVAIPGGWLAKTRIADLALSEHASDFFAAAIVGRAWVCQWELY